jgi:hypothetical protein
MIDVIIILGQSGVVHLIMAALTEASGYPLV